MRFSQRTNWNTDESALACAHRLRVQSGAPIADLTASNPTRCGFAYPPDLLQPLSHPDASIYSPHPRGLLTARQAVADYYHDHGARVYPDQVILTTSTSEAYSFLFRLLCDPGSEILIAQPGYPLFDFLAGLDDVVLKPFGLIYDHGWQIDPEAIRRAVTARTRAIVLVHPNNPTGHFIKKWEADELAELCREFDLSLIVDEVFLDYEAERQSGPMTPASIGGSERAGTFAAGIAGLPVFTVSGLSKVAGLPQMKAAWIVVTGPEASQALDRLEVIADTFLSMNAPVQSALPDWLSKRAEIQRQIRSRVASNLLELDRQLLILPELCRLELQGGWYAILRIPAIQPDADTVFELLNAGIWIHPGYFFGLPSSGWIVLSLLAPGPEFITGVTTLVDYFETHQGGNRTSFNIQVGDE